MNNSAPEQSLPASDIESSLGIENYPEELRSKIVAKFGEILFKRLLLLLPEDRAKDTIDQLTSLSIEEGMQLLVSSLDTLVPNAAEKRAEIASSTIEEFKATI